MGDIIDELLVDEKILRSDNETLQIQILECSKIVQDVIEEDNNTTSFLS